MDKDSTEYHNSSSNRMMKRELVVLFYLSSLCFVTVSVPWLFLTVPWVGLQCVIVVFPGHTYLLHEAAFHFKI